MFGLSDNKKKKAEPFVFELEKELKDPAKYKEIVSLLNDRMQKIKGVLREGIDQESLDQLGMIMQGYDAIFKVVARCLKKSLK